MKNRIILCLGCLLAFLQLRAQVNTNQQHLCNPNSFSIVLLGDPQNYVKYDYNQPVFELMTAWTAHHIDSLRVKAVLCTGDLVDQNECILPPFPRFGNLTSREQWTFVSRAFGRLDNKVPYLISTGNHDYGYTRSENSMTRFPEYFPIERNSQWKKTIVAATNNRNGLPTLENAAMEITDEHWGRILIIAVEFAPRDEVLSWARELVATPRFKDHTVILITHSYLTGFDSKRITKEGYKITPSNTGEGIWQKLVQPSANIRLVLCGHYATPNERLDYTTGFRTDKNAAGHDVHQMMFLAEHDLEALSIGNHVILEGKCWATVSEYIPKEVEKGNIESHLRFVDLQYVLWGNEKMGLASDVEVRQAYNSKKDVAFYTSSRIKHYSADAGSFFLFFPSDIHQPSVRGKGELVKSRKIVIKIEYVD